MLNEFQDLEATVKRLEERGVRHSYYDEEDEEDEEDDDESISRSPVGRRRATSTTEDPSNPKQPRAHFQLPDSPPTHSRPRSHSYSHGTFPRSKRRSTSAGAFASTFQSLRDSFAPGSSSSTTALLDTDLDSIWTSQSNYAYDARLLLKRRLTRLYISLTNLRSYAELNYTGFRKIIKKYDKVVGSHLERTYLPSTIQSSPPFGQASRDSLSESITVLTDLYAKCITFGDATLAQTQLKAHLREQIAWERDTVWRLMIGRERRGEVGDIGAGRTRGSVSVFTATSPVVGPGGTTRTRGGTEELIEVEETTGGATLVRVRERSPALFHIPLIIPPLPNARARVVRLRVTKRRLWIVVAILSFWGVLRFGVIKDGTPGVRDNPANACFAVLVFCTILWASEVRGAHNRDITDADDAWTYRLYPFSSPRCSSRSYWSCCASYAIRKGRDYPLPTLPSSFFRLLCSSPLTLSLDMSFRPSFHPPLCS